MRFCFEGFFLFWFLTQVWLYWVCESYNKISDLNAPNLSDLTSESRPRLEQISDERQLIVHGPMISSDVQEYY